jgi:hypothetical protein
MYFQIKKKKRRDVSMQQCLITFNIVRPSRFYRILVQCDAVLHYLSESFCFFLFQSNFKKI